MLKKLFSLALVALFTISLAGSLLAADIMGKVTETEDEGRYITVKSKDGKEARFRISSSTTDLSGVGSRDDIKVGQSISATYDANDDRQTASKVKVSK